MEERYYVVEYCPKGEDDDAGCSIYFVQSSLPQHLFVRMITYASVLGGLRLLAVAFLDTLAVPSKGNRPSRYFVRLSTLLDPRVFLGDQDVVWSLLSRQEAKLLVRDWMDDPYYQEGVMASATANSNAALYFRNRVDSFAIRIAIRWAEPATTSKSGKRNHGRSS